MTILKRASLTGSKIISTRELGLNIEVQRQKSQTGESLEFPILVILISELESLVRIPNIISRVGKTSVTKHLKTLRHQRTKHASVDVPFQII